MQKKETFSEKALKRVQSGEHPKSSIKKRRLSRIILIVDGLLVIGLLIFFYNKNPEQTYLSSSVNFKNVEFKFSINSGEKRSYFFTLEIKSDSNREKQLLFNDSVAELIIKHNNKPIIKRPIGENITRLILQPNGNRRFIELIKGTDIKEYADLHPELIKSRQKTLFQVEKPHIPMKAEILINLKEKISTSIDFNCRVD